MFFKNLLHRFPAKGFKIFWFEWKNIFRVLKGPRAGVLRR